MIGLIFGILFVVFMLKIIGIAIKAAWGITKILFMIIFFPIVFVGIAITGLIYVAIAILIVGVIGSFIASFLF